MRSRRICRLLSEIRPNVLARLATWRKATSLLRARRRSETSLLLASIALGATYLPAAAASERFTLSGKDVAVFNLVGSVAVVPGSGAEVTVDVVRAGKDASTLSVETGPKGSRQTLRVRYPGNRIVYPPMGRGSRIALQVRPDGTFDDDGFKKFGSHEHRVNIFGSGSGTEAHANLNVRVPEGQKVSIYMVAGKTSVTNVAGEIYVENGAGTVTTSGTRGWLRLDSGSGSVHVSRAQGDLYVDSGSGKVEVSDVSGKRLSLDSGSGQIDLSRIQVDELDVESGSGGVEILGLAAPEIQIDVGSGGVKLDLASDVDELSIDSGSGGVTLRVPEGLGAELDVSTGSGSIDIRIPCELSKRERDHVRGRIGDGGGKIGIDSGSGSVRIEANGGSRVKGRGSSGKSGGSATSR